MDNKFRHYTPLTEEEIDHIWDNAVFVFDANILLHIYRYTRDLQDRFFAILEDTKIQKRIFTPHQVAEEFHRNRPAVICDQLSIYQKVRSIFNKHFENLCGEIEKAFSHTYHPFLPKESILEHIENLKQTLLEDTEHRKEQYPVLVTQDEYLLRAQSILLPTVGKEYSCEKLIEIHNEAMNRYNKKIPPGYEDMDKGEPGMFGDYIMWKQVLEHSKNVDKDIIFVSDDLKEDWVQKEKGHTIGLRPELKKEFSEQTGRTILYYNSPNFIKYVTSYIDPDISIDHDTLVTLTDYSLSASSYPPKTSASEQAPVAAGEMIEWWYSNYEDPANGVPYETREGGYQYVYGGPYDAEEELQAKFPKSSEKEIRKALNIIENDGLEWVKKGEY